MTLMTDNNQTDKTANFLGALTELFETLQKQEIRYCHWKSNIRLEDSLRGETDFDLLIDRKDSQAFRQILNEQNIKLLVAAPGRNYPSMENYLGFDEKTGSFFHLHVHYKLVLGERFVKNYRLPFENDFLAKVNVHYGVKVPVPELEIIVLSIRALLKYRARDLIKDNIPFRGPGLNPEYRVEIEWLLAQTNINKIVAVLNDLDNVITADEIEEFLRIARSGKKAGFKLQLIKSRIKQRLSLFQRSNAFSATIIYFRELWLRRNYWRSSPITKMTFPEGGQTIALIGADGAGKSTITDLLVRWLSWKLDVYDLYLGSTKPSRRSSFSYFIFRLLRRSTRLVGEKNLLGKLLAWLRDILLYLHHYFTGHDRYKRYESGEKRAIAGSVVLFDRYPLEAFNTNSVTFDEMDAAKIPSLASERKDPLTQSLMRAEQGIYGKFRSPDCVIVLDVSPEISISRKPDHDPEVIEKKIKGVRTLLKVIRSDHRDVRFVQINADLPFDQVVLQIKKSIWALL